MLLVLQGQYNFELALRPASCDADWPIRNKFTSCEAGDYPIRRKVWLHLPEYNTTLPAAVFALSNEWNSLLINGLGAQKQPGKYLKKECYSERDQQLSFWIPKGFECHGATAAQEDISLSSSQMNLLRRVRACTNFVFCHFFPHIAAKSWLAICKWKRKPDHPTKTTAWQIACR